MVERLEKLFQRYPQLICCKSEIEKAVEFLISCYKNGNKLLVCGNGGSASDSEHIVGELMKGFLKQRPLSERERKEMRDNNPFISEKLLDKLQGALPAISLTGAPALTTAFCNDVEPEYVFAQQLIGLGKTGDVLIGITTSGNAGNVCMAAQAARGIGMKVISLTGKSGGRLRELSDVVIAVPEEETYAVQELHLPVYHTLCVAVEEYFYEK